MAYFCSGVLVTAEKCTATSNMELTLFGKKPYRKQHFGSCFTSVKFQNRQNQSIVENSQNNGCFLGLGGRELIKRGMREFSGMKNVLYLDRDLGENLAKGLGVMTR